MRAIFEIDEKTGWCVSKDQVNQVAANMGVAVGQGQQLGCPPGQKLVVEGKTAVDFFEHVPCSRDQGGRDSRQA